MDKNSKTQNKEGQKMFRENTISFKNKAGVGFRFGRYDSCNFTVEKLVKVEEKSLNKKTWKIRYDWKILGFYDGIVNLVHHLIPNTLNFEDGKSIKGLIQAVKTSEKNIIAALAGISFDYEKRKGDEKSGKV